MYHWKPYVSVAARRAAAAKHSAAQKKKGIVLSPVVITGRTIASSFWGRSWCDNLETYSDFENRLPRGRTYVRNGSVVDLRVNKGEVLATVSGSSLYKIVVRVKPLAAKRWQELVERHASHVSSVVDLLSGRLPKSLLEALADRKSGLFPSPAELDFKCSCPDWASMCKHIAAVLYGIGTRLDAQPELFFVLRGVEVSDLATRGGSADLGAPAGDALAADDLGALFGIELAQDAPKSPPKKATKPKKATAAAKAPVAARAPAARAKSAKTITSTELRERGVPPSTLASWVRQGTLTKTSKDGVYRTTPVALERLARYRGRS